MVESGWISPDGEWTRVCGWQHESIIQDISGLNAEQALVSGWVRVTSWEGNSMFYSGEWGKKGKLTRKQREILIEHGINPGNDEVRCFEEEIESPDSE